MARTVQDDAVLLRSVDYRDADRILTLYLREHGRISCIARGARSSRRRFSGALEAFSVIRAELSLGRSDLATLKAAGIGRTFPGILQRLSRMQRAGQGIERLRALTVDAAPEPRLFDAVVAFFEGLQTEPDHEETLLLAFQARALALTGFSPGLDACMKSGAPRPEGAAAYFDGRSGGIVAKATLGGASGRVLLSGGAIDAFKKAMGGGWHELETWPARDQEAVRCALDDFFEHHITPARRA